MDIFKNFLGKKKDETIIDPSFKDMGRDELINVIYSLQEANTNLKIKFEEEKKQNDILKNSFNDKKKKSIDIKNIYQQFKNVYFSNNEIEDNTKDKEFNDFLYDQYLFYGGLEEDEINDLNEIKVKDDNWSNSEEFFLFKQKVIERNYHELFRNMQASKNLIQLYGLPNNVDNNNIDTINNDNIKLKDDKKEDKKEDKMEDEKENEKNIEEEGKTKRSNNKKSSKEKGLKLNEKKGKNSEKKNQEKKKQNKTKIEKNKDIYNNLGGLDPLKNLKNKNDTNYNLEGLLDIE